MTEESFLLLPAVLIGIIVAAGAVAFHELIVLIRMWLYGTPHTAYLYGPGVWLLIAWPALGGLCVGIFARFFGSQGHGVPEVIESVIKTQGFIRPVVAIQKIITASITIGTGGSAGAEGPIVQVGAAIASGVGQIFRIARHHMPILVGCGTAAGISSIFNSPIGGVLFTLEVILQDFSIRAFAPLMIASVVANVTTRAIFQGIMGEPYNAIFAMPADVTASFGTGGMLTWTQLPNFALLGIACGIIASSLTKLMLRMEQDISRSHTPKLLRPAIGGAAVGVLGVLFVMIFGWWLMGVPKPFAFANYPMPAFFGDGYGVVQQLLSPGYYLANEGHTLLGMLAVLCIVKVAATCLTLASGGSGGVIAPSLFLGATTGAALGVLLQKLHLFSGVYPAVYALIGMGAVLGAVVHAPLAAILILLELTSDYHIILPAMVATILAVGTARFIFPESVYSMHLRTRGIRTGSTRDLGLLRRISVEQIGMEPASVIDRETPMVRVLELMGGEIRDAAVVDEHGAYFGMLCRQDIEAAVLQPHSLPLLVAGELARPGIPLLCSTDDLDRALEVFAHANVGTLAVSLPEAPDRVVGVLSHQFLMKRYHELLEASR